MKYHYYQTSGGDVYRSTSDAPNVFSDCVKLSAAKGKAAYRDQTIDRLRTVITLSGSDRVHAVIISVAPSGMSREIAFLIPCPERGVRNISPLVAIALDWPEGKHGGVRVSGGGMDMAFHTVDCLSHALGINLTYNTL